MYKICFYAPEEFVETIKLAMFEAGAGKIGNYSHCSWQTKGEGQFKPLENSTPFLGKENTVEKVAEYKVEMVCEANTLYAAVDALKNSHPYETPAYHLIKVEI